MMNTRRFTFALDKKSDLHKNKAVKSVITDFLAHCQLSRSYRHSNDPEKAKNAVLKQNQPKVDKRGEKLAKCAII